MYINRLPELAISVILGNIILPPQGHSGEGINAIFDFLRCKCMRKRWNKFRGVDESVGVAVTKTDSDPNDDENSDETQNNPFFLSRAGNL